MTVDETHVGVNFNEEVLLRHQKDDFLGYFEDIFGISQKYLLFTSLIREIVYSLPVSLLLKKLLANLGSDIL